MIINKTRQYCIRLFPINRLVVYKNFSHKPYILKKIQLRNNGIEVWFTDQNSKPLEIEDRINLTMAIK